MTLVISGKTIVYNTYERWTNIIGNKNSTRYNTILKKPRFSIRSREKSFSSLIRGIVVVKTDKTETALSDFTRR